MWTTQLIISLGALKKKPVGNTASDNNDLKQPVAGLDSDVEPKKTRKFHITSIKSDYDVETTCRPDEGYDGEQVHSAENVGVLESNIGTARTDTTASNNVQPKKKISFQVTSIESTEGRSRGDSNGYDDLEELNESDFVEEETDLESNLAHSSGNGNGTSRFKVVKIPRYDSKPYTRGRWRCWDFVKHPPPSAERLLADLPGCSSNVNDRPDHESVNSTRNLLASSASSGAVFKPTDAQIDLPLPDGNTRPNIGNEAKISDEKGAVFVASEFTGNPSSSKLDNNGSDLLINNSSGLENFESLANEPTGALTDEATLR